MAWHPLPATHGMSSCFTCSPCGWGTGKCSGSMRLICWRDYWSTLVYSTDPASTKLEEVGNISGAKFCTQVLFTKGTGDLEIGVWNLSKWLFCVYFPQGTPERTGERESIPLPSPVQSKEGPVIIAFTICLVSMIQLTVDDGICVLIFLVRFWVSDWRSHFCESLTAPTRMSYIKPDLLHFTPQMWKPPGMACVVVRSRVFMG